MFLYNKTAEARNKYFRKFRVKSQKRNNRLKIYVHCVKASTPRYKEYLVQHNCSNYIFFHNIAGSLVTACCCIQKWLVTTRPSWHLEPKIFIFVNYYESLWLSESDRSDISATWNLLRLSTAYTPSYCFWVRCALPISRPLNPNISS